MHFKFSTCLVPKLTSQSHFISPDFFFLMIFIKCTFPFNFAWLLSFKIPELISFLNSLPDPLAVLTSTEISNFCIFLALVRPSGMTCSPSGTPLCSMTRVLSSYLKWPKLVFLIVSCARSFMLMEVAVLLLELKLSTTIALNLTFGLLIFITVRAKTKMTAVWNTMNAATYAKHFFRLLLPSPIDISFFFWWLVLEWICELWWIEFDVCEWDDETNGWFVYVYIESWVAEYWVVDTSCIIKKYNLRHPKTWLTNVEWRRLWLPWRFLEYIVIFLF